MTNEGNIENNMDKMKKNVKDAWIDTKAAAEKAGNKADAEFEKL